MPSPGNPNTRDTPHSLMRWISASATVVAISVLLLRPDRLRRGRVWLVPALTVVSLQIFNGSKYLRGRSGLRAEDQVMRRKARAVEAQAIRGIDRLVRNVRTGRFERALSGLTAVGSLVTAAEIYFEHDKASFGNKLMWLPVALGPIGAVAGVGGVAN